MRRALAGPALLLLALLAACATPPVPAPDALWGRLSVVIESFGTQPARQAGAGFELSGNARQGELSLSTPVGSLLARARWAPGRVELQSAEGSREFASLEELSEAVLGERLPLQALADWLRGRPWDGAAHATHSSGFEQLGWVVQTDRLADRLVVARRTAAPAMTLRARLEGPP